MISFHAYSQDVENVLSNAKGILKNDPLTISGGLNANATFYDAQGIENRRDPFYWAFNGNFNISILGKISCPLTFTITQQDKKFTHGLDKFSQPFNQFGISPSYKWLTVHAGYRTINFSEYSQSGTLFLGGGIEVKPTKSKFSGTIAYGRFLKAIPVGGVDGIAVGLPAYERWGGAGKLKYGSESNHVEMVYFAAKDDPYSIEFDTINQITPKSNQIIGIITKQQVNEKLSVSGDFHYSMYNPNTYLPVQKLERFTYINKVFDPRSDSKFNAAYNLAVEYKLFDYNIGAKFKRIDPDYYSLGSVFIANDVQEYSLTLSKQFFKNKLSVNGSLGTTENNLDKNQIATQRRIAGSVNTSISLIKNLNLNLGYNSFSSNVVAIKDVFYDSIRLTQLNQSGMFSANYSFGTKWKQSLNLTTSYQESGGNKTPLNTMILINPSYNITIQKTKTTFTSALSFSQNNIQSTTTKNIGPTLGIQQGLMKQKVKTGANFTIQDSRKNDVLTNYNIANNTFITYSINKSNSLKINHSFIYRKALVDGAQNFKEHRLMINYSYTFSYGLKQLKNKKSKENAEI
jgi:hypothetical protein